MEREFVYESPIMLIPFLEDDTIDTAAIQTYLTRSYDEAGFSPHQVDTGAVITTGEASRKKNAERVTHLFSKRIGKFVCATVGPNLESVMAAHGSGAVEFSHDTEQDVLNIDVGGGTTKLAYIRDGLVEETASINVGARLISFDDDQRLDRLEAAARKIAYNLGIDLRQGHRLSSTNRQRLADRFAELLFDLVDDVPSSLLRELMVAELERREPFDIVTFSGGASEYVYGREEESFNDLGIEFGEAIRKGLEKRGYDYAELDSGIRATVLGSTQHTIQISGNTIVLTDEQLLPLRNVPLVPFVVDEDEPKPDIVKRIANKLDLYDVDRIDERFAFGIHLHGQPNSGFLGRVETLGRTAV